MKNTTPDWIKNAAAILDTENVEKTFLDQAFTFVSNKAGPLMKDPYLLGFEVVYKNEDHTKLVGIFAFKVTDQLVYIPVFFLNGEIKGYDLLYMVKSKMFKHTDTWAPYLISQDKRAEGKGINRNISRQGRRELEMETLRFPGSKSASILKDEDLEGFLKSACEIPEVAGFFREFLCEGDNYVKFANTLKSDFNFASAVVQHLEVEDYMPPELDLRKEASAPIVPAIEIFTGTPFGHTREFSEAQTAEMFKQGYVIEDNREDTSVIYRDMEESLEDIKGGFGDVVFRGKGTIPCYVGLFHDYSFTIGSESNATHCMPPLSNHPKQLTLLTKDGELLEDSPSVYGSPCIAVDEQPFEFLTEITGKGFYVAIEKGGRISRPFYVSKVKEDDGIRYYQVRQDKDSKDNEVRHNPEAKESDYTESYLGSKIKFYKVKADWGEYENIECECPGTPGGDSDLREWACGTGAFKGELKKSAFGVRLQVNNRITDGIDPLSMTVHLMKTLGMHKDAAVELVADVERENVPVKFFCTIPDQTKRAAAVRLLDSPEFETDVDDRFGIMREGPQHFTIGTETDAPQFPRHRIGDQRDPENGFPTDMILNTPPSDLASLAQEMGMSQIFDHGAVGSMVQTYDSISMVDKWIPKMEQALDVQGRMLFLFYMKPGDFQAAYGVDDMENLENQLISNFKSQAELIMNLIKKSQNSRMEEISFPSN